jgi:CRP-like cAMP-binding protein
MFTQLKSFCNATLPLTEEELKLIDVYFECKALRKKEFLLQGGKICDFIAFIASGTIRHFHIRNGIEKTCDISVENSWVTDFQSFTLGTSSIMNLQAMEDTNLFFIRKNNLYKLYKECPKYRLMAEQVAQRATEIAMSLSSDKPEERFQNLLKKQPDLFQRVPQKHIANFLGVSPESLSRIRNRIVRKLKS